MTHFVVDEVFLTFFFFNGLNAFNAFTKSSIFSKVYGGGIAMKNILFTNNILFSHFLSYGFQEYNQCTRGGGSLLEF